MTRRARLRHAIAHAAHYLPAQAPLEVFVHHNTLHAFQHLPFHDGLEQAERKLGVRCYLPEDRYREALAAGRIRDRDIDAVLASTTERRGARPWPAGLPPLMELRRAVLVHGLQETTLAGVRWQLSEAGAARRFRPDAPAAARRRLLSETGGTEADEVGALWRTCAALGQQLTQAGHAPPSSGRAPRFPRDLLLRISDEDPDDLVHPVLIPYCASFLDRGQSRWSMPDRDQGFYVAFSRVVTAGHAVRSAWLTELGEALRQGLAHHLSAEDAVLTLCDALAIADDELDAFIEHILLQLPGWAGMFNRLADAPGPVGRSHARVALIDFLAVRLTLDVMAYEDVARRLGFHGALRDVPGFCLAQPELGALPPPGAETDAWALFQVAQLCGLSAAALQRLGVSGAAAMLAAVSALHPRARLRLWHEAYERHYRDEVLAALWDARPPRRRRADAGRARFQIVTCMDDRSESLRRAFEELAPEHETLGAAGFFNLAIAYQGIDDPATFPLCPVVMEPRHRIVEEPIAGDAGRAEARLRRRRRLGRLETLFVRASRSLLWGPLITGLSGFVTALPLLAAVFAPWWTARLRRAVQRWLFPEVHTQLTGMRVVHEPRRFQRFATGGPGAGDSMRLLLEGFDVEEKAVRVATLLENMGLTRGFARVVAILGHDSSSANNPYFAAYSCGACGGRSGGPNARLLARMANRPEVRDKLRSRGIVIPDDTVFIGGVHDTCCDQVTFYGAEALPAEQQAEVHALAEALAAACRRNAQERCRRFDSAPADPSLPEALHHVEERSQDLSQPRPELGHATNAACVVGRRALSQGVFLDRRVFLVSYDPTIDPAGAILERTLLAVGPVGAGINLEYFFSSVDNERLGAGTKLPHNVTGLLGVMNGASSDLRTGLPRQMIEIHEPVRLHLIIEARPETLSGVMARQPAVRELIEHEWVRVALVVPEGGDGDPAAGTILCYTPGAGFQRWLAPASPLPVVEHSADWYRGKHGFVPAARICAPGVASPVESLGGGGA